MREEGPELTNFLIVISSGCGVFPPLAGRIWLPALRARDV